MEALKERVQNDALDSVAALSRGNNLGVVIV